LSGVKIKAPNEVFAFTFYSKLSVKYGYDICKVQVIHVHKQQPYTLLSTFNLYCPLVYIISAMIIKLLKCDA